MRHRVRLLSDESGVALALAVMIVVVAAVMGAGLLVFVRGDIQSAVQANQGQRAFYAADAGVKSASRHLLSDALPENYDDDGSATAACDEPADETAPDSSDWSVESGGRTLDFSDGGFTVSVRHAGAGCGAPGTGMKSGISYFEVVSEGSYREARRRVEAVYSASEVGAPLAVYASGDVTLGGGSVVSGGSVFSGGDATVGSGAEVFGEDRVYGDWRKDGYNATSRASDAAGIAAAGIVTGGEAGLYYDSGTDPAFVAADPDGGELTYPFSSSYWQADSRRDFMREDAATQGNLLDTSAAFDWPDDSDANTVVYVDLTDSPGDVDLTSAECGESEGCRGTLVVENGGISLADGAVFRGNLVTLGDEAELSISLEKGSSLEGSAASGGDLFIGGEISAPESESYLLPGMHGVRLESWRELYE